MIFWTYKCTITHIQRHKYKYTNTQIHCDEVPEIPNMCYILEKPGVQGHQKWYSELSKIQIHRWCDNYVSPNLKLWTTDPLTDFCTVPPGLFGFRLPVILWNMPEPHSPSLQGKGAKKKQKNPSMMDFALHIHTYIKTIIFIGPRCPGVRSMCPDVCLSVCLSVCKWVGEAFET